MEQSDLQLLQVSISNYFNKEFEFNKYQPREITIQRASDMGGGECWLYLSYVVNSQAFGGIDGFAVVDTMPRVLFEKTLAGKKDFGKTFALDPSISRLELAANCEVEVTFECIVQITEDNFIVSDFYDIKPSRALNIVGYRWAYSHPNYQFGKRFLLDKSQFDYDPNMYATKVLTSALQTCTGSEVGQHFEETIRGLRIVVPRAVDETAMINEKRFVGRLDMALDGFTELSKRCSAVCEKLAYSSPHLNMDLLSETKLALDETYQYINEKIVGYVSKINESPALIAAATKLKTALDALLRFKRVFIEGLIEFRDAHKARYLFFSKVSSHTVDALIALIKEWKRLSEQVASSIQDLVVAADGYSH